MKIETYSTLDHYIAITIASFEYSECVCRRIGRNTNANPMTIPELIMERNPMENDRPTTGALQSKLIYNGFLSICQPIQATAFIENAYALKFDRLGRAKGIATFAKCHNPDVRS
jgi:hypothetical protein